MITLQPGEVIDADTMEVVKAPVITEEKKTVDDLADEVEDVVPDKEETKDAPVETAADKSKKEEMLESQKKDEELQAEEKKKAEEDEDESSDEPKAEVKKEEDEIKSIDEHLAEKYADRFDIKSEEDLDAVLGAVDELQEENDRLKAEKAEWEKGSDKPKFTSEQEEKAFEFLKAFDVSRLGDGMQTLATVITMDLKTADPKMILEEKFILENPELTREEAMKKFNRDYKRKYELDKNSFENTEDYQEELEMVNIDKKADVAKAKEFLAKKQTELKAKPKEADQEVVKQNESVQKSIKAHDSELNEFMTEFNSLIFSPTDNEKDDFVYKLSKDQLKQVQEAAKSWIRNPGSYDAKGNLVGWVDSDKAIQSISSHLFGPDMVAKAYKHGLSKGEIKRAEQIAKVKPERVAKVASTADDVDELRQWEDLAKKAR